MALTSLSTSYQDSEESKFLDYRKGRYQVMGQVCRLGRLGEV